MKEKVKEWRSNFFRWKLYKVLAGPAIIITIFLLILAQFTAGLPAAEMTDLIVWSGMLMGFCLASSWLVKTICVVVSEAINEYCECKYRVLSNLKKERFTEIYIIKEEGQEYCCWERYWARIIGNEVQVVKIENGKVKKIFKTNEWSFIEKNFKFTDEKT